MARINPMVFEKDYQGKLGYELPDTDQQLFMLSDLPALDPKLFHKNFNYDDWEETLSELMRIFLDSLPKEQAMIQAAHDKGDWKKVKRLAHKMKGGCLGAGLQRLNIACQFLERYIKAGHNKINEPLYQQMMQVIHDSVIAANEWLKTHHNT